MELADLQKQTVFCLQMQAPDLGDTTPLVEECFSSARKVFTPDFMLMFRPEAWAKITLSYHTHFLDTGCDITVAEMFVEVVRDAISTNRMDFLTLNLAQHRRYRDAHKEDESPQLKVISGCGGKEINDS